MKTDNFAVERIKKVGVEPCFIAGGHGINLLSLLTLGCQKRALLSET